jgi:hypothetical protein
VIVFSVAAAPERGKNIFDDDWTPPRPAETQPASDQASRPPKPASSVAESNSVPPHTLPNEKSTTPSSTAARLAVPDKPAQAAVRQVMKRVFADQLADRSIASRRKLAAALLAQADKSTDAPADRFVLLEAAIDAAVEGADLPTALRAGDELAEGFDVDGLAVKTDAVTRLGPHSGVRDSASENVAAAIELSEELVRGERFADAARVCAALQPAAATNPTLKAKLQQRQRELVLAREAGERYARDVGKLKRSPDDPAANLAAGRYACFVKGDWDRGLAMLAKGSDATLREQAALELAGPVGPGEVARAADGWWDVAAKQQDRAAQAAVKAHAADLYGRALQGGLTGLRKSAAEQRVAEATTLGVGRPRAIELLPHMQGKTSGKEPGVVLLRKGDRIATESSYKPPVAFRIVAQTESTDIRIGYAADQIIFNWQDDPNQLRIDGGPANGRHKPGAGAVPTKTWVTIGLVVRPDSMTISVDGEERQVVKADFSAVDQRLSIFPHLAPLLIKSVQTYRPPK